MPKFEVHIPGADSGGMAMTLKVSAENWMSALKAGMAKLGEQGSSVQNVMVDIQEDNSIHVTESRSGRVFRIRELTAEEAAKAPVKKGSIIKNPPPGDSNKTVLNMPAPDLSSVAATLPPGAEAPTMPPPSKHDEPTAQGTVPEELKKPGNDSRPRIAQPLKTQPPKKPNNKSSPKIDLERIKIEELEHPTKPITAPIGRPKSSAAVQAVSRTQVEDVLAEIFERVQELPSKKSADEALAFVLDLAMEKVPADAGSVLKADTGSGDLSFVEARGPRSKELLSSNLKIPAGTGFAGFCSAEGVSVAISDVEKDPRYYAEIAEKLNYETRSLLCAPMMTHGRSFGCLQLINRKGGPQFLEHEVGLLSYLAHQAALYLNERG